VQTTTRILSCWRPWRVQIRGYCYLSEDDSIRQFVLCEKNLGWMGVWEVNIQWFGWLSSKPSANSGGGIILPEGHHAWIRQAVPFSSYTLLLALQLKKQGEPMSRQTNSPTNWSLRCLGRFGQLRLTCWAAVLPTRRTKQLLSQITNGGVLCKHQTSFLLTTDHSYVRNS
jgi:hypothetical protein